MFRHALLCLHHCRIHLEASIRAHSLLWHVGDKKKTTSGIHWQTKTSNKSEFSVKTRGVNPQITCWLDNILQLAAGRQSRS